MPLPLIVAAPLAGGFAAVMSRVVGKLLAGAATMFSSRAGMWFAGAMTWLGLSYATHSVVVGPLLAQLQGYVTGTSLSGAALMICGALKVDVCSTMIFSAVAAKFAMQSGALFLKKRS